MERPHRRVISFLVASRRVFSYLPLLGVCLTATLASAQEQLASVTPSVPQKRIIGPTTIVADANSALDFKARVDTGAMTTSVHVEEWAIEGESEIMQENVGKNIRFRMKNHKGESQWLESRIEEIGVVKTSEQTETRYKVKLTLCWNDVKKQVLVTLNDRSHMKYPMLLGRNFLSGDFVVDVDLSRQHQSEVAAVSESSAAGE